MLEPRFPVARPLRLGLWLGSIAAVGSLLSGFAGCQGPDTFLRKPGSGAGGASHGVGGSSFGTGGHGTGGTFGTGGSGSVDASGRAARRQRRFIRRRGLLRNGRRQGLGWRSRRRGHGWRSIRRQRRLGSGRRSARRVRRFLCADDAGNRHRGQSGPRFQSSRDSGNRRALLRLVVRFGDLGNRLQQLHGHGRQPDAQYQRRPRRYVCVAEPCARKGQRRILFPDHAGGPELRCPHGLLTIALAPRRATAQRFAFDAARAAISLDASVRHGAHAETEPAGTLMAPARGEKHASGNDVLVEGPPSGRQWLRCERRLRTRWR